MTVQETVRVLCCLWWSLGLRVSLRLLFLVLFGMLNPERKMTLQNVSNEQRLDEEILYLMSADWRET